MIAVMKGTIVGCYDGFQFEVPEGEECKVIRIVGDVVYFDWEDDIATTYRHNVELYAEFHPVKEFYPVKAHTI